MKKRKSVTEVIKSRFHTLSEATYLNLKSFSYVVAKLNNILKLFIVKRTRCELKIAETY